MATNPDPPAPAPPGASQPAPTGPKWRPLAGFETIWQAERVLHGVPLRSVALRLSNQDLVVYSPIRGLGEAAHRELTAIGRPRTLVAPNVFHNLGLREYATTYPGVDLASSGVAIPRLERRCRLRFRDETHLPGALPDGVSALVPPGTRNGELWLAARAAGVCAWMVGDAFFNIARTPRSAMGLLLLALGISPGLRIGSSYRWLVRDRPAYKRWLLRTLDDHPPTVLVPCHGDVLRDPELPARLRRLVETRF